MLSKPQPTTLSERISSLDFLRGIAVLGILLINIESFSYPDPWSPYKFGFDGTADTTTRFIVYLLAQGKFFSMFTLLFGVGFYIFLERLESRGLGLKVMDIYARRLLWLFLFGVIHAYLIWDGDILYHYAICGFLLFPFRSFRIGQLLLILLIPVSLLLYNASQSAAGNRKQFQAFTQAAGKSKTERSQADQQLIERWPNRTTPKAPDHSPIKVIRKTYFQSIATNAKHTQVHKGVIFYQGILFRTLIMMIFGIILYRLGIFQDYRSIKYYWPLTISFLIIALTINYLRYYHWTFDYFHPVKNTWQAWLFAFPKETLGLAYILFLNGLYQKYLSKIRFKPISSAGRMALTNYISQNVICGLIFYGYGLGYYNQLSRSELLWIVAAIWLFQLSASWLWLQKFRQGPLEWLWRKLSYYQ
ncbi:MAG: DUF418 domain-containing protein [Lewinella sp.]|nr:DUF418 domain-containing protein [Lewinella sp.]